ncbi:unnamed protein product [Schistosoma curassoni]|uniref:Ovule protein n=1 Tax=Schistosoma curassoni TaxID=6186 RepID=A0A183JX96_9TREM|nr:unnamed protein product [Schistosoma curassoni]
MSRQFYCMGLKLGELQNPSSRRYNCILTVFFAKYFGSIGQKLSTTTFCGREQTRSQRRKKILKKHLKWIEHTLRKPPNCVIKQALT